MTDKDSNGLIDETEFKSVITEMDIQEEDFQSVDLNSDGEIEYAEIYKNLQM